MNAEDPAFPWKPYDVRYPGMSKREYFAARAMEALIKRMGRIDLDTGLPVPDEVADHAAAFADALLARLDR